MPGFPATTLHLLNSGGRPPGSGSHRPWRDALRLLQPRRLPSRCREASVQGAADAQEAPQPRGGCRLTDFKVKEMRVVGDKLTKSGILPSDHFGVFTVIELSVKTGEKQNKNSQIEQVAQEVYFQRPVGWEKLISQEK